MGGGARAASTASSRPGAARRRHAARLRRRPRRARRVGDRARARARRARLSRPARLRGGALRAAAGARQRRAQARRGPRLLRHLVRTRRRGARTRRPAAEPEARHHACRACSSRDEVAALLDRIPARDAARAARPRDVRARLLLRAARRGDRQPRPRRRSTSTPRSCGSTGKGSKTRLVPVGEPAQRALERYLSAARPALAGDARRARPCSSRRRGRRLSPSDVRRRLRALGPRGGGRRAASRRTRCATRSRPTCSRAGPTCARSRSCWATRASRRPRSTLGSSRSRCAASTHELTRGRERRG